MKRNLIGFTDTDNKRINYASQREFERAVNDFGPGMKVNIIIETYRRKRSLSQNNLLHFYFGLIAEETGETLPRIKEMMKMMFGVKEPMLDKDDNEIVDKETGDIQYNLKSTADYTTEEMSIFVDQIIKWSFDFLGMTLPSPDDARNNNLKI